MSKKLCREGDPDGQAEVAFDPEKRANYHLDRKGQRVYHEVPEGYRFTAEGALELKPGWSVNAEGVLEQEKRAEKVSEDKNHG